jgi:pimeloyl-ACP methyl ester carboxylesterase
MRHHLPEGRMEPVEQRIATTRLRDGSQVAYALAGDGPFLVYVPGWLSHLELSWALPPERGFYAALARGRTLLRYDKPGCGLSGPADRQYTMELELETLEAVTRAAGAERFDLLGISLGAPVAASWAAAHPGSVARLVLYGGWARGQEIASPAVQEHVLGLVATHWGFGSDVLADIFAPGSEPRPGPAVLAMAAAASTCLAGQRALVRPGLGGLRDRLADRGGRDFHG